MEVLSVNITYLGLHAPRYFVEMTQAPVRQNIGMLGEIDKYLRNYGYVDATSHFCDTNEIAFFSTVSEAYQYIDMGDKDSCSFREIEVDLGRKVRGLYVMTKEMAYRLVAYGYACDERWSRMETYYEDGFWALFTPVEKRSAVPSSPAHAAAYKAGWDKAVSIKALDTD